MLHQLLLAIEENTCENKFGIKQTGKYLKISFYGLHFGDLHLIHLQLDNRNLQLHLSFKSFTLVAYVNWRE